MENIQKSWSWIPWLDDFEGYDFDSLDGFSFGIRFDGETEALEGEIDGLLFIRRVIVRGGARRFSKSVERKENSRGKEGKDKQKVHSVES